MSLEVQATYENGVLKPDKPLPLKERERVTVSIVAGDGSIRRSAGMVQWSGTEEGLDYLLGPDNEPGEGS
jgi:predicted DNA-binding antitoxin AbrB/MazE fold protein